METEAIQTDVAVEKEETPVSKREAGMNAIVAELKASQEPQGQEPQEDVDPVEDELDTDSVGEAEHVDDTGRDKDDDVVMLRVGGKEIPRKKDEVYEAGIRTLQKETSVDQRLAEAAALHAENEKRAAEIRDLEAQLIERATSGDVDPNGIGEEFVKSLYSDDDKAGEIISSLTRKLSEIEGQVKRVTHKEASREEAAAKIATAHFHKNYEDLASDSEKLGLFNVRFNQELQKNPHLQMAQVVDLAAEGYYDKFGGKPVTEDPVLERKRKLPNHPKAGSARQQKPPEVKRKTTAEIIAEMGQKRGGSG